MTDQATEREDTRCSETAACDHAHGCTLALFEIAEILCEAGFLDRKTMASRLRQVSDRSRKEARFVLEAFASYIEAERPAPPATSPATPESSVRH